MSPRHFNTEAGGRDALFKQDLLLSARKVQFSAVAQATKGVEGVLSHFFASWLGPDT